MRSERTSVCDGFCGLLRRRAGWRVVWLALGVVCVGFLAGCGAGGGRVVVVYTALDRSFSEPLLTQFEARTGIRVLAKYDTEATKTVGLVNAIRMERLRPRCDVFWNNEIVNTIRLKEEGLLAEFRSESALAFPAAFRDPAGYWCGFAGRARVLLVNTNLVSASDTPTSIYALADPKWRGRAGMAKPLFGTTATHVSCLFVALGEARAVAYLQSLKRNEVRIQSGNKTVALNVSAGRLCFGLTDTDDAIIEKERGQPVRIVYPDSGPGELGVLLIPNSVALVNGAPHAAEGRELIEYLLSPEVEALLAESDSAQIPLNPSVRVRSRVKTVAELNVMDVDFAEAAARFAAVSAHIEKYFLR